ncbi:MAG: LysM peptidoglycan-binding domain-containing protein [Aggregatilineales bacterium]
MLRRFIGILLLVSLFTVGFVSTAQGQTYTVAAGDNLYRISLRFGVPMTALATANNLTNVNLIFVGQQLVIPGDGGTAAPPAATPVPDTSTPTTNPPTTTGTYAVAPGDTLGRIAQRFGTTFQAIASANNIANPNLIFVGQVLNIPGADGTVTNPPPTTGNTDNTSNPPPPTNTGNTAVTTGFELGGQIISDLRYSDLMRGTGMTWIKQQLVWNGSDDASVAQGLIDSAHSRGFRILLSVIGDRNQLAANPTQYYQNFANFLGGVAARGADGIEVWNEMNIDREWPSGLISGAQYTQMLSAAFQQIKANNNATLVVSGAPAPTGAFGGCSTANCDDNAYIAQMASAGAAQFMDCVGVHYNSGTVPPSARVGAPVAVEHYSWYYPQMVELYSGTFPGKPLCFTEIGYLTSEGYGPLPGGFSWAADNTVAEQAEWLAQAAVQARNSGLVRLFIVWNVDSTGYGEDPQAGYAIIRPDGTCSACNTLAAGL